MQDTKGDTALSLAAKNENSEIVQYLLQHSASVASSGSGEGTLSLIYGKTPAAVIGLLNSSVSFHYGQNDYDLTLNERSYCLNLT
jgi:ankyrin repeat protein